MFYTFSDFKSILSFLYNWIICRFSYYYLAWLSVTLLLFLCYRQPYCYRGFAFGVFLLVVVFSMFLSLCLSRVESRVSVFFGRFLPVGTPLYICPLVCLAERVRYVIRPIVLILRPFINISLGCIGGVALCSLCFINWWWIFLLVILFFYEVFVAIVHWYIVVSILRFSIDH